MYGKLINGVLKYAPKDLLLSDNSVIIDFYKNEELLVKYGYKCIDDTKPNFDPITQYLTLSGYTESENLIMCEYIINNIPKETPTTEEKISKLEQNIELLNDVVQELILNTMSFNEGSK